MYTGLHKVKLNAKDIMKYQLHIRLLSQKLVNKVEAIRAAGLNPSVLIRNYLENYKIPTENTKKAA